MDDRVGVIKIFNRFVICLTGMPGAGKSTVAKYLEEKNFYLINMGDIIREKAKEMELDLNDKNLGELMRNLRKEHGNEIVAKLILQKIKDLDQKFIVVDGIRSYDEYKVIKKLGFVKLLSIHASSDKRFDHIKSRDREDSPADHETFLQRDKREMDVGISNAIALSDESISNNNITISELRDQVQRIVDKWMIDFNQIK